MLAPLAFALGLMSVDVRVDAPPQCPSGDTLTTELTRLLGQEADPQAVATVAVTSVDNGFDAQVEVTTNGAVQRRTLYATDCTTLFEASALIIAVGLDPMTVSQNVRPTVLRPQPQIAPPPVLPGPPPLPTSEPTREPEPTSEPRDTTTRTSARSRPEDATTVPASWSIGAQVGGGLALGLADGPSGQVSGGFAVARNALRVELGAHHEFARDMPHPEARSTGALVDFTAGRLGLCWAPTRNTFVVNLCGGARVGQARARGRGLSDPRTARSSWIGIDATARALWRPRWWIALGGGLAAIVSAQRPTFAIDDFDTPLLQVGTVGLVAGPVLQFTFFDESRSGRR